MKAFRLQILCCDSVWRYVFCRTMNGPNDPLTNSAVITTERRPNAYVSYSDEQAERDITYFSQHSHGLTVRTEAPIP